MPWRRLHLRIIDPADKSDGYLDPDVDVEGEARYPWRCLNAKYAINTDLTAHDLEQLAVRHAAAACQHPPARL